MVLGGFGWFRVLVTTANIAQTGCIRVYCSWFWVVLVGFVGFAGSFGWFCWWFWLV